MSDKPIRTIVHKSKVPVIDNKVLSTFIQYTTNIQNVICYGDTNGFIDLTILSGTKGTLSYLWSNTATTQDLSSVGAGSYHVDITDDLGTYRLGPFVITQPTALTATYSVIDAGSVLDTSPFEAIGSISVVADGGTPPYVIVWSDIGGGSFTRNNLAVGTYSATITDANGCTLNISPYVDFTIPEGAYVFESSAGATPSGFYNTLGSSTFSAFITGITTPQNRIYTWGAFGSGCGGTASIGSSFDFSTSFSNRWIRFTWRLPNCFNDNYSLPATFPKTTSPGATLITNPTLRTISGALITGVQQEVFTLRSKTYHSIVFYNTTSRLNAFGFSIGGTMSSENGLIWRNKASSL